MAESRGTRLAASWGARIVCNRREAHSGPVPDGPAPEMSGSARDLSRSSERNTGDVLPPTWQRRARGRPPASRGLVPGTGSVAAGTLGRTPGVPRLWVTRTRMAARRRSVRMTARAVKHATSE